MRPTPAVPSIELRDRSIRAIVSRRTRLEELPDLLSVLEFCAYMGIGRSLGYELIRTAQVDSIRLGRRVMVPRRAILELLGLES